MTNKLRNKNEYVRQIPINVKLSQLCENYGTEN